MDPRLQRRVQRYGWDKAAAHYEAYWARNLAPAQEKLLEMAELQPGERVLDVACGTGLVTLPAAERVTSTGFVFATDISQKMIERVLEEARKAGSSWVEVARLEAEALRWEGEPFDAALCALGLMYVPDPALALSQVHQHLKSGGRAVSAVWGRRDRCGWAEIFPIVDAHVESEVCPLFFQLGTGGAQAQAFRDAGFDEVLNERFASTLHHASEEEALGAAFAGGPVALAYSRFDDATRDAVHAEYLRSIAPYRTGDRFEIPGEFVITRGVRKP